MNKNLFEKFAGFECTNIHFCTGGERAATTVTEENAGPGGCTSDSQEITQTSIPNQTTTVTDYSDWQWECSLNLG